MVREAIAELRGAEIRTEGDSFFVVFPSPSLAVRAALATVERAEADADRIPTDVRPGPAPATVRRPGLDY
jgi:class 3 adenylate cyclase